MTPRKRGKSAHTGHTQSGNTRDVKVERLGKVTIYQRGTTYTLYYREDGKSVRRRIDGNLAVARATAAKVSAAIAENRASPLGFSRTAPERMVQEFLDHIDTVKGLAWRTQDRYRAALARFTDFCDAAGITVIDAVREATVEDFVRWLRGQTRTRNGARQGKRDAYKVGGIRFILSTCRTAYHWAARRRMLPPYSENPFSRFPIDSLRDPTEEDEGQRVFTADQEQAFFAACSPWQRPIFTTLATYGMRVGELTHLLIEDVDLVARTIQIRSKPELHWRVKTARRRQLPLTEEMWQLFGDLIGTRKSGFVFLDEPFVSGGKRIAKSFETGTAFRRHLEQLVADLSEQNPEATARDERRAVQRFCRQMWQLTVKRVRLEFCKLTEAIGCPEFTRTHDLRHLFSSRAQERGINPLLVQDIMGHTTLSMTKRYTHLGMETKREAISQTRPAKEGTHDGKTPGAEQPADET